MRVGSDCCEDSPRGLPPIISVAPHLEMWLTPLLIVLETLSLSLFVWQLRCYDALTAIVRSNDAAPGQLRWGEPALAAQVGVILGVVLASTLLVWGRKVSAFVHLWARRATPLALLAFAPALFQWRIWVERDLVLVLYVLTVVLATKAIVHYALTAPPLHLQHHPDCARLVEREKRWAEGARSMFAALPRWSPTLLVFASAAFYAAFFAYHTIVHHRNVLSASLDLGLEDNLVWNVLHWAKPLFKSSPLGGPTASHLGFHATWFAFVLVPFYAIRPNAETLLLIQAILLGGAAIPLYLLGRRYVGHWQAALIAVCYLLYPGLHGSNLYDFHYLPLGPFFMWFVVYFIESRRWFWATLFVLITLSIREDVAVGLGFLGGLMLLSGRRPKDGLLLLVVGAAYFIVMKGVVMHKAMGGSDAFVHQYRLLIPEGERGFNGVIKTILSNPLYTLSTMMERQKLIYFLQIALPLAFLPLRRPIGLWAAVPGFLFTLLSTEYPPLLMISFQYTSYWIAQLFPASLLNLRWMDQRIREGVHTSAWKGSWIAALLVAILSTSYQYGAMFQNDNSMGGFGRYHFGSDASDYRRRAELRELTAMVPPKAKVAASENIVPQVSNRPDAYTLRIAVFDADYILFRLPSPSHERENVLEELERDTFGILAQRGEFVLAKRGHSTEKNDSIITRLGGSRHGRK